jgi:DnaJ-domain-containing protein 1
MCPYGNIDGDILGRSMAPRRWEWSSDRWAEHAPSQGGCPVEGVHSMSAATLYSVIDVSPDADEQAVKKAVRRALRETHQT